MVGIEYLYQAILFNFCLQGKSLENICLSALIFLSAYFFVSLPSVIGVTLSQRLHASLAAVADERAYFQREFAAADAAAAEARQQVNLVCVVWVCGQHDVNRLVFICMFSVVCVLCQHCLPALFATFS